MVQLANRIVGATRPQPGDTLRRHGRKGREPARATTVALSLLVLLGGCAAPRTIVSTATDREVPVERAFVSLGPGTPAALSVIERAYANGARQTIRLVTHGNTPGENSLRVDVIGATNADVSADALIPDTPLKEADLSAEAEDALPGVPLRSSMSFVKNRYGPFGYAIGRSAQGDECLYAWQRLATPDQNLSVVNSRDTLAVRLRLCEPHVDEARLAATMMGLNVNVALTGGAFAPEPKPLSPEFDAPGTSTAPPEIVTAAANPLPPRTVRPMRSRIVASPRPAAEPVATPPPGAPPLSASVIVPPPPVVSAAPAAPQAPPATPPIPSNPTSGPKS
jgi:hypothetical protein